MSPRPPRALVLSTCLSLCSSISGHTASSRFFLGGKEEFVPVEATVVFREWPLEGMVDPCLWPVLPEGFLFVLDLLPSLQPSQSQSTLTWKGWTSRNKGIRREVLD
jgi:hypothetical protein